MWLDYIPRYGRLYTLLTGEPRDKNGNIRISKARWKWQKRGRWGMNILDSMGLMWPYIDTRIQHIDTEDGTLE